MKIFEFVLDGLRVLLLDVRVFLVLVVFVGLFSFLSILMDVSWLLRLIFFCLGLFFLFFVDCEFVFVVFCILDFNDVVLGFNLLLLFLFFLLVG